MWDAAKIADGSGNILIASLLFSFTENLKMKTVFKMT
jgi:hypothetical protein